MRVPQKPPGMEAVRHDLFSSAQRLQRVITADIRATYNGRYCHWEKVRRLSPPKGLSVNDWWLGMKLARAKLLRDIPLRDAEGRPFRYAMPDEAWAMVHRIDKDACGSISIDERVTNPETRDRYIINSLIEEAITSSQLEGAATTTPVAKEMIRSGRQPRDEGERMILNNYRAMRAIRSFKDEQLTPKLVFQLHRMITEGTIAPEKAGRLRTDAEYRVVTDGEGNVLHCPPKNASELPRRLQAMCAFANAEDGNGFIHPVVRAVLLHLWLAYDHPFVDGNGRTARALFYWSMLHRGHWLCEYLSISSILKKAPAKYARAFLYTESDDNDATYFIMYQLDVAIRSIDALHAYLKKKTREIRQVETLLKVNVELNHRQLALVGHALRHSDARYTIKSHQRSHGVVYETARSDLLELAQKKLLAQKKHGRTYFFYAPDDLAERLSKLRR